MQVHNLLGLVHTHLVVEHTLLGQERSLLHHKLGQVEELHLRDYSLSLLLLSKGNQSGSYSSIPSVLSFAPLSEFTESQSLCRSQ